MTDHEIVAYMKADKAIKQVMVDHGIYNEKGVNHLIGIIAVLCYQLGISVEDAAKEIQSIYSVTLEMMAIDDITIHDEQVRH